MYVQVYGWNSDELPGLARMLEKQMSQTPVGIPVFG